jgi:hypothetical protein
MKNITKSISLLSLALLAMVLINCGGGGSEAAPEKVELKKLSKQWSFVSASLTGVAGTPEQITTSFKLTITGTYDSDSPSGPYNFSVTGTNDPSPWPSTGTWTFAGEPAKNSGSLLRNDGVGMVYSINSSGQLTLTFTCTECDYEGARTNQVNGTWTFVLN